MNLNNLTVGEYMQLQLIIDTFKDDENKMNGELIKKIHGTLNVEKRVADESLFYLLEIITEESDFIQRFEYNGVEYGFEPNLDNIKVGPFLDLDNLMKDGKQLHKICAILYRPITKKIGKLYQIEEYEGTSKYSDIMEKVNYKVAKGAMFFFINLLKALIQDLNTFTENQKMLIQKTKE